MVHDFYTAYSCNLMLHIREMIKLGIIHDVLSYLSMFKTATSFSSLYMDSDANLQLKQECSRAKCTTSLDKIFADLVVRHIQQR